MRENDVHLECRKACGQTVSANCVGSGKTMRRPFSDHSPVWKSKFYGAFVLNHHVVLHAIDATPTLVDFPHSHSQSVSS